MMSVSPLSTFEPLPRVIGAGEPRRDADEFDAVIDVNLRGVWNTCKTVVPAMIEAGRGGSIVITSSASWLRGQAPWSHYVASKHAVVGLMRALANELAAHSIRVNTVHPTGVETFMSQQPDLARIFADPLARPAQRTCSRSPSSSPKTSPTQWCG